MNCHSLKEFTFKLKLLNMKNTLLIFLFFSLLFTSSAFAQEKDSINGVKQDQDSIAIKKNKNKKDDASVYTISEMMPTYLGGEEAMYKYLAGAIQYPQYAKEHGIRGTVIISFIVEQDGSLSDVKITKDIGGGCGTEAVRVIKGMPNWIPGLQDGIPIRVQYNLPIKFTLTGRGCFGLW